MHIRNIFISFILFANAISNNINAQITPTSENELLSYYERNIDKLDPIEGVYDWIIEQSGENAYMTFPAQSTNEKAYIYKDQSGNYKLYGIENTIIKRVGGFNIYNYVIRWPGSNVTCSSRFAFKENTIFDVNYSIPDQQLRYELGRKYQAGFKVKYKLSFIKEYPTPEMYAKQNEKESMQKSSIKEWSGSGFALNNGFVVTNYHVIENAKSIRVQVVNGNSTFEYNAIVVSSDKVNDLAIIKIKDSRFNGFGKIPYQVKTSISDVGEDIFVLGYPMASTMGDEIKLTTGVISSKTGYQGDVSLYQISAPVQPGNSGGPLFDKQGKLIGIVSAKHKDAENVGYAIKASYLKNLVESAVSTSILPSTNSISNIPLTNQVKSLKNFVFMIKCSTSEVPIDHSNNTTISHDKTINNPNITTNCSWNTKVLSIRLSKDYTIVTLSDNNLSRDGGYYSWMTIDPQTYILANGQKYKLIKAEGIALSPSLTYFSHAGETKTFTLYFPPIPQTTSSIDLIESMTSEWRFYGIKLD